MAELSTIARPYARAVFEQANETGKLQQWSDMLEMLVAVTSDENMAVIIAGTRFSKEELASLIIDICADKLDVQGQNLVRLLAENGRLTVLPEIAARYEILRAEAESTVEAEMLSAMPVSNTEQEKLSEALKQRLGRNVNLKVTIDKSLVGGAVIRAGDMVIDGSASGKLNKLAAAMNQ